MEIIHELETKRDIRVNVTAMMSAQQCFLAAMAGATWVSIFGGRVNNMGYNACDEITKSYPSIKWSLENGGKEEDFLGFIYPWFFPRKNIEDYLTETMKISEYQSELSEKILEISKIYNLNFKRRLLLGDYDSTLQLLYISPDTMEDSL